MSMTVQEAYRQGFEAGLQAFAWWADGVQYVGTCGTTLANALAQIDRGNMYAFRPPIEQDNHAATSD